MEPVCDYCKGTGHVRYDGNAFVPCADVHIDAGPCHICDNTGSASEAAMYWYTRAQAAEAKVAELTEAATANHYGCDKTGCRVCEVLRRHASRGE